jgi:hypothetical protein
VADIEIGHSMALAIEYKTQMAYIIGTNSMGELGLSKEDGVEGHPSMS